MKKSMFSNKGLYNSKFEHDACGIGAIANIHGVKSHKVVLDALIMLSRLDHRGGIGADEDSGDGAGILVQIPHGFFKEVLREKGIKLPEEGKYAVANMFFSNDKDKNLMAISCLKGCLADNNLEIITIRDVPVTADRIGKAALLSMPVFKQVFVKKPDDIADQDDFERLLYMVRRETEKKLSLLDGFEKDTVYFESFSSRTIVYKGMLRGSQLQRFYNDLNDERFTSALSLVHSRFSTNTFPSWSKAHPNRYMIHNGEINTIRGNSNWLATRQNNFKSDVFGDNIKKVLPVINDAEGSDSAMLDNALEFFMMNGRELPEAVIMTIPEPWDKVDNMAQYKKDYYRYYANMMEPWDGPAAIVFTDGIKLGAVLDRNGLRPARYFVTNDGYLILSSEVGVLDINEENIKIKDRLRPGKMLLVDTKEEKIIDDEEIKNKYMKKNPYGKWLHDNMLELSDIKCCSNYEKIADLVTIQKCFGYHVEDIEASIVPMSTKGAEQIGAMGIDVPLAVLTDRPQLLFNYFKQLFAQVTNPPIDAIREKIVTSTETYLGSEGNILKETEENCRQLKLESPIISNDELKKIESLHRDGFNASVISILFDNDNEQGNLKKAMDNLFKVVDDAIGKGNNILILTDRGVSKEKAAIPSLLAVSGVHHYLIKKNKRISVSIVLESGEPRESHHFAALLGYGASAINPYIVYETIKDLSVRNIIECDYETAVNNYNKAALNGIVKILSKMGISTVQSYQAAQRFEAIGLNKEFIDKYFTGTVSVIEGIGIEEVQKEYLEKHNAAFNDTSEKLENDGSIKFKLGKEKHLFNPIAIRTLQKAVRTGDYQMYKQYSALIDSDDNIVTLRDVLGFKYVDKPLPMDEVEPVDSIVKRFKTGAMSYGSISKEAHEALAIAMNKIGGRSNSGEGGEDKERFESRNSEDNMCSAIKQVASGRFGVTSEYLVNAKEIQIKIAQGAKPGEGGHLPAAKVYPWIAKTRHSTTGVGLISPPPHHDIYSIEDLSQLIYDLKNANKEAEISVKLVSEAGVGTVAAGVAKGGAQIILISGYDGGTGAAARTSIKNTGLPWELGLAETNQTLIKNNLRGRVSLETDGKLMTGRDVAVAALLGAEQFGFATAPLIALGCVMMRVCNLNTCPLGIATQDEKLRKNFKGRPEYVVNFMRFVAEELREYMSKLGFRTVDEMVGRVDMMFQRKDLNVSKCSKLDLSSLLHKEETAEGYSNIYSSSEAYDFKLQNTLDEQKLVPMAKMALEYKKAVEIDTEISNTDRAAGTILGYEVTKRYPDGLKDDTIKINCQGSAGQSFAAFVPKGITMKVEGDLNDYAGKGLSGGKIIAYPPKNAGFEYDKNIIVGNVALYGATSGEAYFEGIAGERFAVRNSGAHAVVEGTGEHGCEYMTGGVVVVLGKIGKNFAAGMSGGIAYIYDEDRNAESNVNTDMIYIEKLSKNDEKIVLKMIKNHYSNTKSKKALRILENFDQETTKFIKIMPKDYEAMIELIKEKKEEGLSDYGAELAAFNMRNNR
ncbi:glutamate synthase large subunit [Inconstantimicrobium porci]|uniref:Glutamate synthase large subunit n=1 Tax=Inconstantimicrobium porci TaxID=2652291 RepID=A0A7X2T0W1_9CLOT|nr:glutamate synthase large subunit [Inconstantimicrobium porci]